MSTGQCAMYCFYTYTMHIVKETCNKCQTHLLGHHNTDKNKTVWVTR